MMDDTSPSQESILDAESPFTTVPIEITVSVGKARPFIRELVNLGQNSVLPLDKSVEDPVDLFVGDRLIARGMLEEADAGEGSQLVVRLTELIDLKSTP